MEVISKTIKHDDYFFTIEKDVGDGQEHVDIYHKSTLVVSGTKDELLELSYKITDVLGEL